MTLKRWIGFTLIVGLLLIKGCDSKSICSKGNFVLNGANGIAFDKNNHLYIASLRGNEIVVVDPATRAILKRIGPEFGVKSPDDLAFGPDGSLYWTSFETGKVCSISPSGQRKEQMVAPGVNPITFSDDGRLFVAVSYKGDALYQLDPLLIDQPRLIVRDLGWLNGMDWGQDGYLYAPVYSKGEVVRIDVKSGANTQIAFGFGKPAAVKFDSKSRLHVVDYLTGGVWRIDLKTGNKQLIVKLSPKLDNLAFDSRDRLYVSNNEEGQIYIIFFDKGNLVQTLFNNR